MEKNKIILIIIALVLIIVPFIYMSIKSANSPHLQIPVLEIIWMAIKTAAIIFWELAKRPFTWVILSIVVGVGLLKRLV